MNEKHRFQVAITIVEQASGLLLQNFSRITKGGRKNDGSMVSKADREAEALLVKGIRKAFPHDGILSEESPSRPSRTGFQWIIDPLDGTHNFLAGLPVFGTLLALSHKEKILFSICAFPLLGETCIARRGQGAFLNGKAIQVSRLKTLKGGFALLDGNYRKAPKKVFQDMRVFAKAGCRLRLFGSSPFSLTRVAKGQGICALNRAGTPWDIAAPALLVEEAGGKVSEPSGKPWSIHSKEIIATNGVVHKRALKFFS